MNPPESGKRLSRWDDWYRRALPAYWIFLFCITHFRALRLGPVRFSASLAHLCAYALLAFLLWRFGEAFWRPLPRWYVWFAGVAIALYGAVDEWSQQYFGRGTDVVDWLFDVVGAGIVLALLERHRRRVIGNRSRRDSVDSTAGAR